MARQNVLAARAMPRQPLPRPPRQSPIRSLSIQSSSRRNENPRASTGWLRFTNLGKAFLSTWFLRRSFKILAHETGHMFSIAHCTVNECLMNGSNSLDEMDRNTLHLCPVCLRKLQWSLRFGVRERYRQLRDLYQQSGYDDLAQWIDRRLTKLEVTAHSGPSPLM
jgi:Peptidase family M54